MNKTSFAGALAALALAVPGVALAQQVPAAAIVIVDRDRIARECTACKTAQSQLQGMANQLQTRQQQLQQQLQPEAQSIQQAADAAGKMAAGAARTNAENQVRTRLAGYQQKEQTANQELAKLEQNVRSTQAHIIQQIGQRLDPIVVSIMKTRGASIAIDEGVTIAHSPAIDVTNDALAQFNSQVTSLSVTPLPQPAQQQPAAQQPQQPPGR